MDNDFLNFGGGVLGFLLLVLDLIVILEVLRSERDVPAKLGWCLLVFCFPIVGIIVYFLMSNRNGHHGYAPIGGRSIA
jgi:hypothetical protein